MQIVGVEVGGAAPLFSFCLAHGEDPHQWAWERGYRIVRPLSATGTRDDLTVTLQVTRHGRRIVPRGPQRARTLVPSENLTREDPLVRQRLAAYALVVSPWGILATEFSERTAVPGLWSLPGGGLDPGENPATTVQREVMEETGQRVEVRRFIDLQTDHWIGNSPSGVLEDFHAVRLIYAACCFDPTQPVVHDSGGTTADSRWVPMAEWRDFHWVTGARALLTRHANAEFRLFRQARRNSDAC